MDGKKCVTSIAKRAHLPRSMILPLRVTPGPRATGQGGCKLFPLLQMRLWSWVGWLQPAQHYEPSLITPVPYLLVYKILTYSPGFLFLAFGKVDATPIVLTSPINAAWFNIIGGAEVPNFMYISIIFGAQIISLWSSLTRELRDAKCRLRASSFTGSSWTEFNELQNADDHEGWLSFCCS